MTISSAGAHAGATLVPALLFSLTLLWGGHIRLARLFGPGGHRSLVSLGAGMAAAYVFVHLMPELHGARHAFAESTSAALRHEGMAIYFVSLVGFLSFYGLDHLGPRRRRASARGADVTGPLGYRLHVGGYAVYAGLIGYLLVHRLEESASSIWLYTAAMAMHFLGIDHSLRELHEHAYQRSGRLVLAAAVLAGWGAGQAVALPTAATALLLAAVSGAVIMNSLVNELPSEAEGRLAPFLAGGLLYGAAMLPLG